MEEYSFSYLTNKTTVRIENGVVHVKIGPIIRKDIKLESILYFYVHETKDYCTLIIRYEKDNSKYANQRMMFAHLDKGALEFVNSLSQMFPEKDLRGKDVKEALKTMKAVNSSKLGFVLALVIILVVITAFFVPSLIHYFDNGFANATVNDVVNGTNPGTRNLRLSGVVLNAGMWEKTTNTNKGSVSVSESNYFPIVSPDWEEGNPVHILLDCGPMTQDEIDSLVFDVKYVDGVLENIWWEGGIDSDQAKFFKDEYGIEFADDAVVFNIHPQNKAIMFYVYLGIMLLLIIIFGILYIKQRKK